VRSYAKNGMVKEWSQGLVDTMIDAYDPRVFLTNHVAGGAVKRVGETDTAFPHRNAELMLVFVTGWGDPAMDQEMIQATRTQYAAIEPYMGGYYDNIEYDRDARVGNYGPAYQRLSRIKAQYDPGNLFRLNSNIEPAA
jgi:FAD/FMN-containing dehydrogenase